MTIQVGINGFGRIGRGVLRIICNRDDIEVVAINDLFENEQLAYLLKYDTVMGIFEKKVRAEKDAIYIDDHKIVMTEHRDPGKIPWKDLGVQFVIEATGVFRNKELLEKHLAAGANRVILTDPAKDEIDATIVMGVNDHQLKNEHKIVSNASCTTNCLAPIVMIIDDAFGIEEGFITTVHAYTNDQRLADVPHKDFRRSRAAGENIIPTTTGAAKAVGVVLPKLQGRFDGLAMRVPVPDGSIVDLALRLTNKATREEINEAVKNAALGKMRNIVEYSEEPYVSSDIIGNTHSSIFDALSTSSKDDGYARILSWYDNEWGYSNRVVDLIEKMAKMN